MTQQRVSPVSITSVLPATVTLSVQGALGQSADMQQWRDSTGLVKAYVASGGELYANSGLLTSATAHIGTYIASAKFTVNNNIAGNIAQIVRGAASQTADIFQAQDSAGSHLSSFNSVGYLRVRNGPVGDFAVSIGTTYSGNTGLIVRGVSGQTASLTQWQLNDATATVVIDGIGRTSVGVSNVYGVNQFGRFSARGNGAQESYSMDLNGSTSATALGAVARIRTAVATEVGLVVQGFSAQTGDLQRWNNSSGTTLAKVESNGNITGAGLITTNQYVVIGEQNSGGTIRMLKQLSAGSNPGAEQGRLYFRDGTNAGTLKLVVRAGTAGAETTILDNIPQT